MDKEIDFSSLNDKSFKTREEAVDALTQLLEDNNFKKRECADNELAVAGTGSTQTQVSARHNANDIKSPNTGFGSGSEMAILLIVVAILAIVTVYLVKFSKKSSKIFNFVLAGFMAVFMSFSGIGRVFAQDDLRCGQYGPYDMFLLP
ncbi:MAG: hypothetical protein Q4A21_00670 [bacterium]|nr:hypothetical protein [bacterium]